LFGIGALFLAYDELCCPLPSRTPVSCHIGRTGTVSIPAQGRRVEYVYWADASATTLKSMEQTEKPAPGAPK